MITQIILRFKDLPEKDRIQICHNLLIDTNVFLATNTDYKVFYKQGGINKPMIEVKNEQL